MLFMTITSALSVLWFGLNSEHFIVGVCKNSDGWKVRNRSLIRRIIGIQIFILQDGSDNSNLESLILKMSLSYEVVYYLLMVQSL